MTDEEIAVIDTHEMGCRYGLNEVDVVRDGVVVMRDHIWTKPALLRGIEEVRERSAGYAEVKFPGHCASWVIGAFTYAARHAKLIAEIGPGGQYKIKVQPFPMGKENPECGLGFGVLELDDRIYVTAVPAGDPGADAHGFDMDNYDKIVMPPITPGKIVLLAGEIVNPIAVSMLLSYADDAKAVFIRFHREDSYVCAVSKTDTIEPGDVIPAEK